LQYAAPNAHAPRERAMLFLSGLPVYGAVILLVVLPTLVAMCGPIVVRRFFSHAHLAPNNEIAGFKFATVGVIYAVLLAFAVIVVWEKFSDAEDAVVQEAGAAATLYRLVSGPEPENAPTKAALDNYLRVTIDQDWPQMAAEKESRNTTLALNTLYSVALRMIANNPTHTSINFELLRQLDAITQARRARLHLASGIVPGIVWLVLFTGAILTVCFTFFFGAKHLGAQVVMTGILSVLVFMGLLAIVSIDHPFTGPFFVGTEPLQAVLEDFSS
jgi:Protein of unknown function (DUF4239)